MFASSPGNKITLGEPLKEWMMDMRQRVAMRRLIDVTIEEIRMGAVEPVDAARALHDAGVSFKVIGRVVEQAVLSRVTAAHRASRPIDQDARLAQPSMPWSVSAA